MPKKLIILPETKKKQSLQKSIDQKKRTLHTWNEKIEMLRMELDLIKHEYDVRIGYLLLKDNQLDLEIIKLKNLKRLMNEGMTYAEAIRREEDAFYNEILRMQEEAKKIEEEKEFLKQHEEVDPEVGKELKVLWKKLIRMFHPDLVQDREEKQVREDIMKQVNNAYAAGNLEVMQQIALTHNKPMIKEMRIEDLEQSLVDLENALLFAQQAWFELKISEWFGWKKKIEKAKKTGEDVFAALEKSLLDDITKKITLAQRLREEVHPDTLL